MAEEQIKYSLFQGEIDISPKMQLVMAVYEKLAKENKDFKSLNDDDKLLKAFEVADALIDENHKKRR